MKKILIITIILLSLATCTTNNVQIPEPTSTDVPEVNMPNPASVYCEQNGNKLEIHNADDGSQSGVCVFPDGYTCDEWAYFRGECGMETLENPKLSQTEEPTPNASGGYMQPGTSEPIEDWWGVIKSTPPGAQYDDYFERQDLGGSVYFGIDSLDPEVADQILALRDSGKVVHLYGTLFSNVPDYNGSQVQIDRIEVEGKE
jgi:putative hemolysin